MFGVVPLLDGALHLAAAIVDRIPAPDPELRRARLEARHAERMARLEVRRLRAGGA